MARTRPSAGRRARHQGQGGMEASDHGATIRRAVRPVHGCKDPPVPAISCRRPGKYCLARRPFWTETQEAQGFGAPISWHEGCEENDEARTGPPIAGINREGQIVTLHKTISRIQSATARQDNGSSPLSPAGRPRGKCAAPSDFQASPARREVAELAVAAAVDTETKLRELERASPRSSAWRDRPADRPAQPPRIGAPCRLRFPRHGAMANRVS